jgi:hypothetical protein
MPQDSSSQDWAHIAANLAAVRADIAAAAEAAGRDPGDVELVAVSKTFPVAALRAAMAAGQTVFGENRVQEALPKIEALTGATSPGGAPPRFHLVGHLQTNKARHAGAFDMIESVDSLRLAAALERRLPRPTPVLIEVNVAGEASKHGFAPDEVGPALTAIAPLGTLDVVGLMTVAPLVAEAEAARPVFRELRRLRDAEADRLGPGHLSMGMSDDFQVAIAEGATIVRLGRAIFGDRRA